MRLDMEPGEKADMAETEDPAEAGAQDMALREAPEETRSPMAAEVAGGLILPRTGPPGKEGPKEPTAVREVSTEDRLTPDLSPCIYCLLIHRLSSLAG